MIKKFALILPIITGVLFGSVGIFARKLNDAGFDNATTVFSRVFPAVIILLIFILIKDRSLLKIRGRDVFLLIMATLGGMFSTNLLFNMAAIELSLSFAAVLLCVFPIYVLIFSKFAFKERITARKLTCIAMTAAGCIMVSGIIGSNVEISLMGLAVGILSGITNAYFSVMSKKLMSEGMASYTMTFYCLLINGAALAPFVDYKAIFDFASAAPLENTGFMLLHSLLIAVLTYVCFTTSLKYIDAGTASILASCEPVAAMVIGLIFFDEVPTVLSVAGLIITMAALTILCKSKE